jgi:hypothetical protein
MISQATAHARHPQPARPRWWRRRGPRAAALSLALTVAAAAANGLAATPAWAAGGYHIIATIAVGDDPAGVAVSPHGTRAYVPGVSPGSVTVIDTGTCHRHHPRPR